MDNIRDIVVVIAGIIWSLVTLVALIVAVVVYVLMRKYVSVGDRFLTGKVQPFLTSIHDQVEALNQRTGGLSSRPAPLAAAGSRRPSSGLGFSLPFLRRRRPWWQRILQR